MRGRPKSAHRGARTGRRRCVTCPASWWKPHGAEPRSPLERLAAHCDVTELWLHDVAATFVGGFWEVTTVQVSQPSVGLVLGARAARADRRRAGRMLTRSGRRWHRRPPNRRNRSICSPARAPYGQVRRELARACHRLARSGRSRRGPPAWRRTRVARRRTVAAGLGRRFPRTPRRLPISGAEVAVAVLWSSPYGYLSLGRAPIDVGSLQALLTRRRRSIAGVSVGCSTGNPIEAGSSRTISGHVPDRRPLLRRVLGRLSARLPEALVRCRTARAPDNLPSA